MFDPDIDFEAREAIADQVGSHPYGVGSAAFLHLLAEGYRRYGTTPPPTMRMMHMRRAGSEGAGLAAKRDLLAAWREHPDAPGSLLLLNGLMSDAVSDATNNPDGPTACQDAVGELIEDIAAGRLLVPDEILRHVEMRIHRFRPAAPGR
jgi:hypothetical protein